MSAVTPLADVFESPLALSLDMAGPHGDAGRIALYLSCARVAELASRAAVLEAAASPKPGLVCVDGNGAHNDMNFPLFVRSAHALQDYFAQAHALGEATRGITPECVFLHLRRLGVKAEASMLAATDGVNTHKGLVFSLGLFCAAVGRLAGKYVCVDEICRTASSFARGLAQQDFAELAPHRAALLQPGQMQQARMARNMGTARAVSVEQAPAHAGSPVSVALPKAVRPALEARVGRGLSAGEVMYLLYGATGIRGEAESGFPHVNMACGALERHGAERDLNTAMTHCLLELVRAMDDTTLLWRGGPEGLAHARRFAEEALRAGGLRTSAGRFVVRCMSADFARRGLSPGGCADILAVSVFLRLLRRHSAI